MTDLSTVTVTITDIKASGYCASGARRWFRDNSMDFAAFLKAGMPADQFVAQGDDLARKVVEQKLEREDG